MDAPYARARENELTDLPEEAREARLGSAKPVPDPRARRFVSEFSDMHGIVRRLQVPQSVPVNTARAFITARELIRFSFYHYEFAAVAVSTSIVAIEAALRDRYDGTNMAGMIRAALADGTITDEQADHLDTGREIRNRYAHGKMMDPALPITFAAELVMTSLEVITLLLDPAGDVDHVSGGS